MLIRRSILAYLILSSVFLVWHPAHFLKDVMVAPLFVLVPLGLGLSMTRLCLGSLFERRAVARLPVLLISLFVGFTGQTIVYQQLERFDVLQRIYPVLYPLALCVAAFSFYQRKELFRIASSKSDWLANLTIITPLVALAYTFNFLKFSQYPLRDIFQETHFMKGAMELARFHFLNPFTADSYIPLLQVHLGLLQDWYGYDLLASQWILPVLFAVVRYTSLHCFFSAVTDSKLTQTIAGGLAVITLQNLFSSTNGDMLFSVCLVLISLLIRSQADSPPYRMGWLVNVALMAFSMVLYQFSTVQTIGIFWAVTAAGIAWYSRAAPGASAVVAQSILLCATGVVLHPAMALLYLVCSLGIVGIHQVMLSGWPRWSETIQIRLLAGLIVVTGALGVLFGGLLRQGFFASGGGSTLILLDVAEWILGREITGAEGLRNTLIEWVRLAPPALFVACAFLATSWVISVWRSKTSTWEGISSLGTKLCVSLPPSMLFAWAGCLAGLLLSFSGLPYFHRALYFPLVLLCLFVAILIREEIARYLAVGKRGILLKYGILLLCYLVISGRYGYKVASLGGPSSIPYIQALSPYFGIAVLGVLGLLGAASVARVPWRVTVLTLSILFVVLASDKFAIKSYGYRYSYGDNWSRERPISHYTVAELELAARIRHLPLNTILLSDPYTLSIIEAQTGLNGLYSFSNLGVMQEEYREGLRRILRCIHDAVMAGDVDASEELLRRVMEFGNAYPGAIPEARYVFENRMARPLNIRELKESLVIILNAERTFPWMDGRESYFPLARDESGSLHEFEIAKVFEIIHNVNGQVLALRLR